MNFATAFKTAREKSKLSQQIASDRIGITQSFLSQLETGVKKNPSADVIRKAAKVYAMPLPLFVWLGSTENDVPPKKRKIYRTLKPIMNELISSVY